MQIHNNNYILRISDIQFNTLKILKSKGVTPSKFIRIAIKEKIDRDWKTIKNNNENICLLEKII
jgi:nitrogen regulatory protein PII-like uncharacterized protein